MAFQQLKEYLSRSLVMSRLEADEVLFASIVVASHIVSAARGRQWCAEASLLYEQIVE